MNDGWTDAMDIDDLPEGGMGRASVSTVPVLLARVGGEVFAMSDRCAHMECPLSRGRLEGHIVTCPCHDWRYDVRTGEFLDAPEIRLPTFPCRVEGGRILVRLED